MTSSKDLKPGSIIMGISGPSYIPDGGTDLGSVFAISASTGRTAWKYNQRAGMMSLMSTAGGLVFAGDAVGRFKALDDSSGKKLWEVNLASPVTGFPVSYAVDGKQFVVIGTGVAPEAFALSRSTPEYQPTLSTVLYVFALL
jgi:alcohol dehydrogenase (cytochrome c)